MLCEEFIKCENEEIVTKTTITPYIPSGMRLPLPTGPPFICEFCGHSCKTKSLLASHRHRKHRKKDYPYECNKCAKSFNSKDLYDKHMKRLSCQHYPEFTCEYCSKKIIGSANYKIHLRFHKKIYPFECKICCKGFMMAVHLKDHTQTKHENKRYICEEPNCGKFFQSQQSLKNHMYVHIGSLPYCCEYCEKRYPNKGRLRWHIKSAHDFDISLKDLDRMLVSEEIQIISKAKTVDENYYRKVNSSPLVTTTIDSPELQDFININGPDFCANVHKYESTLTEETVIEEEISQDATDKWLDTLNDIDTKSIANPDVLKVEINEIPQDNIIQQTNNTNGKFNSLDDKVQTNVQELKVAEIYTESTINREIIHQQKANSNSLSKNLKSTVCLICNKSFVSHNKLTWHMRMHDKNRKRFVCPIESCGRIYASKQACDLHYRQTHLDEGIICPICHKIFSAKQTLEVHMRYHTKEFPYKCNLCERKFAQKGHLTQHIEVKHQNLRYVCTEPGCGKIFQNSVSLRNHRYTHSSMPFKCNRCDKEYPQKNKLRAHLLHKHDLDMSLDDLESMRQFNIIRSRHAYVKIQTETVKKSVNISYSVGTSEPVSSEDLEVDVLSN